MLHFTFKKRLCKSCIKYTFTGTWEQFENAHPDVIILNVVSAE